MNGIKIGVITCFDSMYATPLIPLIKDEGISNFIVSHWWNNQYAMFSAASWWQAISKRMEINLLASATWWTQSAEYTWSSGSGIYSDGKIVKSWYNQQRDKIEKLLIGDVPNSNGPSSNLPNLTPYKTISPPKSMCVVKSWYNQQRDKIEKLLIGDVPNSNGPSSNLPNLTPYKTISPPKSMCVVKSWYNQ
eukprot:114722_1